jgi:hypothetical protein
MENFIGEHIFELAAGLIVLFFLSLFVSDFIPGILNIKKSDWKDPFLPDYPVKEKLTEIEKEKRMQNEFNARLIDQLGIPLEFLVKYRPDFFEKERGRWAGEGVYHRYNFYMFYELDVFTYYFKDGILARITQHNSTPNYEGPITIDFEIKSNHVFDNLKGIAVREIDLEKICHACKIEAERIDRKLLSKRRNRCFF